MTPTAVLVLVVGVLVVLAVAGTALALDARRRGRAPSLPGMRSAEARSAEEGRPAPAPVPESPWTEPIDSARAQQDPPTVTTRRDTDDGPTAAIPRPDDRADPEDRAGPT
ncbi:hypothetical protein ACVGOW_25235 [Pseudonocardia saturnea]